MKVSKLKKSTIKKTPSIPREQTLKIIAAQDLREKLSKHSKSFFILLDDQKYSLSKSDRKNFINALMKIADLREDSKEDNILSTQEVADLLNVSRPYVVKLIDSKQLKSFSVGSHRRVLKSDALDFKRKMRQEQNTALDELAEETESLGIEFK